jgi:LPXTG-motif cell wall-anchored protein
MRQRRTLGRALTSVAAGAACLAFAAPAWADGGVPLHQTDVKAASFTQDCDDPRFDNLPEGYDGWHFVLPDRASGDFVSLTLSFTNGDGLVTVNIPDAGDAYPDAFYPADGRIIHAYLFTPAGWTLNSGAAKITGTAEFFNLSHTCAGTPAREKPSTPPSEQPSSPPSEQPSEQPSTPPATTPAAGAGGSLPLTGAATGTIAVLGVALLGGGVTLMIVRRRRGKVTFTS